MDQGEVKECGNVEASCSEWGCCYKVEESVESDFFFLKEGGLGADNEGIERAKK